MATYKTVSIRLTEEDILFAQQYGESTSDGLRTMIERMRLSAKYADREVVGRFTPQEWCMLGDTLNGTSATGDFRFSSAALSAEIEDASQHNGTDKQWGVDAKALSDKIKGCPSAVIEAIYRRVEAYWADDNRTTLEEWANM